MGVHYPFGLSKGKYLNYVGALLLWIVADLLQPEQQQNSPPGFSGGLCVQSVCAL